MAKFTVICGGDFAGKSTIINRLKQDADFENYEFTREPGNLLFTENSLLCEQLREIILSTELSSKHEAALFATSRYLHTLDIVKALKAGKNVICDRYIFSSVGYQSTEGAGDLDILELLTLNMASIRELVNNNIEIELIVLQISEETRLKRKALREESIGLDVLELKDDKFQKKVSDFYNDSKIISTAKKYVMAYSIDPYLVNANLSEEEVYKTVKNIILK